MGMNKFIVLCIALNTHSALMAMEKPQQPDHSYFIMDQPDCVSYCDPEVVDKFSELCGTVIPYATPFVLLKISEKIPSSEAKKPLLLLIEKYGIPLPFVYESKFILHDKNYKHQFHFERGKYLTDEELKNRVRQFMMVPLIAHLNSDNRSFKPDTDKLIEKLLAKNIIKKIENSAPVPGLQHEHGQEGWLENKKKIKQLFKKMNR
jgi:hypothetical protein